MPVAAWTLTAVFERLDARQKVRHGLLRSDQGRACGARQWAVRRAAPTSLVGKGYQKTRSKWKSPLSALDSSGTGLLSRALYDMCNKSCVVMWGCSRLFFLWATPLFRLGYTRPLKLEDLWGLRCVCIVPTIGVVCHGMRGCGV